MKINLFLIPFVIILGLLLKDNRKNRLFYLLFVGTILLFVAAMRHPVFMEDTYGIDTLDYKTMFLTYIDMGWNEIWTLIRSRYLLFESDYDIGFIILCRLLGYVTRDFHVFSLLADLLVFVPLGVLLYRYLTNIRQLIFAIVFYIALVQIFFLGGSRQMFALGFDLMALIAIIDKKKVLMVIFFLLGVTLHFSSILFIIPLLMIWFKINHRVLKIVHLVFFLVFPIVYFYPNQMIQFMGNLLEMEKYANYGKNAITGGANTFVLLIELLSLFCLIAIKRKDMDGNVKLRYFYVMAPLFTLFAPLINSNGTMIRIALYYYISLMLLVPYSIDCLFDKKSEPLAYTIAIGGLSLLCLSNGGITYYFYWQ